MKKTPPTQSTAFVAVKLTALIILLTTFNYAKAQTNVSGNQSGAWLQANSPYTLTGDVTVLTGQTLTIEPGCRILIPDNITLTINGTLVAEGTTADSIYFYGQKQGSSNYGGKIRINPASQNSAMSYVRLDSLGQTDYAVSAAGALSITNSSITNPGSYGLSIARSNVSVTQSSFGAQNLNSALIYIATDSISPVVLNCNFSGNQAARIIYGSAAVFSNISGNTNVNVFAYPVSNINRNVQWPRQGVNSFYTISDHTVSPGNTLTIEPGARINISGFTGLTVSGTLVANGTSADSIYFYGRLGNNVYCGSVNITGSSVNSSISYAVFDSLGKGFSSNPATKNFDNQAISADGPLSVSNCTIRTPYGSGIKITNSNVSVSQCRFSSQNSSSWAAYISNNNISPVIQNCTFSGSDSSRTVASNPGSLVNVINNTNAIIGIINSVTQNSQWPKPGTNSVYKLLNELIINPNTVLTVQPGCRIAMSDRKNITVYGTLIANGTAADSIYFYSRRSPLPANNFGGSLFFNSSSQNSSLKYVVADSIGFGYTSTNAPNSAISISTNSISVSNCTVKNSFQYGMYVNASPTITHTNVNNNPSSYGIYIISGSPTFSNCNIYNNCTSGYFNYSAFRNDRMGVYVSSGKPVFNYCNIYSNGLFGNQGANNASYGIYNASTATADTVDARNCYWGTPSGPYHPTLNASGTGNAVSNKVKFTPWLQLAFMPSITYYPKTNATDLSQISQWTTDSTGGTGTNPVDFSSPNQLFNFNSAAPVVMTGTWSLSGGSNAIITTAMELSPSARIEIGTGTTFNFNNRPVVLRSDASGTASIGTVTGTLSDATNVTVERYIPARRAWRILAAPVAGSQTVNSAWQEGATATADNPVPNYGTFITGGSAGNGFDQNNGASSSIKTYSSTANTWVAVPNTNAANVNANAYMTFVYGNRNANVISSPSVPTNTTLRATGTLKTGDQTFPVSATGFTAIPNPYASPINFQTITRNNVANTFYVWDPKIGNVGAYVTVSWNGSSYDVSTNAISAESQYIQSGQGFLVYPLSSGTAGSITVKESDKSNTAATAVFVTGKESAGTASLIQDPKKGQGLRISLREVSTDKASTSLDEVFASFKDGYSVKADAMDAVKAANIGENLGIVREGQVLSIERRPLPSENDIVALQLWNTTQKNYSLEINPVNLQAIGLYAFIKDKYLNTIMPVSLGKTSQLPFSVNNDSASAGKDRFSIIFSKNSDPVSVPAMDKSITVFPNPVIGSHIHLQFNNKPAGLYRITLLNSSGQAVLRKNIQHDGGVAMKELLLSNSITSGVYQLQINSGSSVTTLQVVRQ